MYGLVKKLLFLLRPETAHWFALSALAAIRVIPLMAPLLRYLYRTDTERPVEILGIRFRNPIGLAAGFDKNAAHVNMLADLGFGFVEVGSVTARSWPGNSKPRLFRLARDRAIINRMGLNNEGADTIAARLKLRRPDIPIFVNVAKTPDPNLTAEAAIADYRQSVECVKSVADVVVINISCPNSGDGRTFEEAGALDALLTSLFGALDGEETPLLVKVSPDLTDEQLETVVRISEQHGVSGFTATNTTTSRDGLKTPAARLENIGQGGLSGAPLHGRSVRCVRRLRELTELPIIGVGGIMGVVEARAFLDAGASLVQLYTGFIYVGPSVVRSICRGL